MARVLVRAEAHGALGSPAWSLVSAAGGPARILRKNGYFGGYATIDELSQACLRFSASQLNVSLELEEGVKELVDFYIIDEANDLVSLAEIPLHPRVTRRRQFHVRGMLPGAGEQVMRSIDTWKVEFGEDRLKILVRHKDEWIELTKPIHLYSDAARSLFVTLSALHFIWRSRSASLQVVWTHIRKNHSDFKDNDLLQNIQVIKDLAAQNSNLKSSKGIQYIIDHRLASPSRQEGEQEDFGHICAICDDGGDLLVCDGPCLRSFHASKDDGPENCPTLGLSRSVKVNEETFFCPNCKSNIHQCFKCGRLGRSLEPNQEVYLCSASLCGRFYHLGCGAKKEEFSCPIHRCHECGKGETRRNRLYPCRRCPRAWHRQCLNVKMEFNDEEETRGNGDVRGWVIGNARFVYCMDHEICPELGAPLQNLKFPGAPPPEPVREAVPEPMPEPMEVDDEDAPIRITRKAGVSRQA